MVYSSFEQQFRQNKWLYELFIWQVELQHYNGHPNNVLIIINIRRNFTMHNCLKMIYKAFHWLLTVK